MSGRGAVLLDLDDTLYAYAPCHAAGLAAAGAALAAAHPETAGTFATTHDAVRLELASRLAGTAASHERVLFFKLIVERLTGRCRAGLALELTEAYWSAFLDAARPGPDVHASLDRLAARWPLALVTNQVASVQLRKLERLGLDGAFDAVITSQEVGAEKPDARVFAAALDALDADPSRSAMVGDAPRGDIAGAAAIGLLAIQTTEHRGHTTPAPEAAEIVASFAQVPDVLAARLGAR